MVSPSSQQGLLRTPLHAVHQRLNGRMIDFAGWEMPVQYPTGILSEHQAVRTTCGLFDLSHMGRVYLRGRDALALAQECCTRDLGRIRPGEAAYSVLCQADGGIRDDVIGYLLGAQELLFVFNASNREDDLAFFLEQRDRLGLVVELDDQTLNTALIGGEALEARKAAGPRRELVGMQVWSGGVLRQGFPVGHDDQTVGAVTSGTFSPTLRSNNAVGYVLVNHGEPGQALEVEMRGKA